MKTNCIIIHGSFGNPFENWYPWLSKKLSDICLENIVPQFPIKKSLHTYQNWSKLLDYYLNLGLINENSTFVCHSIGSILIIKYLIEKKLKVKKLLLVSGINNYVGGFKDLDEVNKSFFSKDINNIHKYCNDITCFYSDNDPYIPQEKLEEFAQEVADRSIIIKNGGHINTESGYTEFPEVLKYVLEN